MLERHRYNALQIGVVEWFVDIGDCAKLKDLAGALGSVFQLHRRHDRLLDLQLDQLQFLGLSSTR
jgi:hypothetical protein